MKEPSPVSPRGVTFCARTPKPIRIFAVAGKPHVTRKAAIEAAKRKAIERQRPILVIQLSISAITSYARRVSIQRVQIDGTVTKLPKDHAIVLRPQETDDEN